MASKQIRVLIIAVIVCFVSVNAFATAQYPDRILYSGKEYMLHSNPLEAYFELHPDKKPKGGVMSSALWRGYVATFEIDTGQLFLKDIQIQLGMKNASGSFETEWKSAITDVVPKGERLKIDWFSGLLVLPFGERVNYVHMGYGSTFKNYILLEIVNAELKRSKEFGYQDYEAFKDRQFNAFKKTPEYTQLIKEMKKEKGKFDQSFADDFLRSFVTNYTSKILVD